MLRRELPEPSWPMTMWSMLFVPERYNSASAVKEDDQLRCSVVLTAIALISVFFVALVVGTQGSVKGDPLPPAASGGDANGDGRVDISDAINILRFLFQDGSPPVACADSLDLTARVSALEGSLAELRSSTVRLACFVRGVSIKMDFPCQCQGVQQCWYDGAVTLLPSENHLIRKGVLAADGIRFSTERDADLLLDFEWQIQGGTGGPFLFFDGTSLNGSPLSPTAPPDTTPPTRIFIPAVKAGDHLLTFTGRALCNDSPTEGRAQIEFLLKTLHVHYLE